MPITPQLRIFLLLSLDDTKLTLYVIEDICVCVLPLPPSDHTLLGGTRYRSCVFTLSAATRTWLCNKTFVGWIPSIKSQPQPGKAFWRRDLGLPCWKRGGACDTEKASTVFGRIRVRCSDCINSSGAVGQECGSQKADELIAELLASMLVLGPAPKNMMRTLHHYSPLSWLREQMTKFPIIKEKILAWPFFIRMQP